MTAAGDGSHQAVFADQALLDDVVAQVADMQRHATFEARGMSCRWCAEPIRLVGHTVTVDTAGQIVERFSSGRLPGGQLYKPCGTRRATRCPSCAALYQGDARQLVRQGLLPTPDPGDPCVATRPVVFATLTAPSFGAVHRRPAPGGPCHVAASGRCRHGRPLACLARHDADDPMLGEALCGDCYDYDHAVLFNATMSELWRRTTIYLQRHLARLQGVTAAELRRTVRLSYVKVAELQRRGAVHLHVVVRVDPADDPAGPAQAISAESVALALRMAATHVRVAYPDNHGTARWGEQLDCTTIAPTNPAERTRVANYLAKYATKGSDAAGTLDRRLYSIHHLDRLGLPPQLRRLVETAWRLGADPALAGLRLRAWAHTLGLRSHFLTKSRRYSTTFTALRAKRRDYRRSRHLATLGITPTSPLVTAGKWAFAGRGWASRGEQYLAACRASQAAEARRLAADTAAAVSAVGAVGGTP